MSKAGESNDGRQEMIRALNGVLEQGKAELGRGRGFMEKQLEEQQRQCAQLLSG